MGKMNRTKNEMSKSNVACLVNNCTRTMNWQAVFEWSVNVLAKIVGYGGKTTKKMKTETGIHSINTSWMVANVCDMCWPKFARVFALFPYQIWRWKTIKLSKSNVWRMWAVMLCAGNVTEYQWLKSVYVIVFKVPLQSLDIYIILSILTGFDGA